MRGFKTEGIILKRRNFGEADRILTVFTLQKGKISVIAKGVRRITSRRAGNVELLNRVIMFLYQGQGMPILTEAEGIESFENLKSDLVLSTVAFHIIELVDKLTAENQENRVLYEHLVNVLKRLEINPRQIFIRAFEVKILSNLGFATFQGQKILEDLEYSSWDEIEKMKIDKKQALELESILRYNLERVIEGSLKSRKFLKKI